MCKFSILLFHVKFLTDLYLHLSFFYKRMQSTQWSIGSVCCMMVLSTHDLCSIEIEDKIMKPNNCLVCRPAEKRKCTVHQIHWILEMPNTVQWMLGKPNVSTQCHKMKEIWRWKLNWRLSLLTLYVICKILVVSRWSIQIQGLSVQQSSTCVGTKLHSPLC